MKRMLVNYGLLITAGVFSFLFALNIRVIAMMIYRTLSRDILQLAGSLVNAAVIITAMVVWLIYIFYLQYRLEKRCRVFEHYRQVVLVYVLPVPLLYAASEIGIRMAIG
jgi:undecaprenyl pyrophosphate phosphatase UppP